MKSRRTLILSAASSAAVALVFHPVHAEKKYDIGATDTEIKIGATHPYSGPASAYGTIGRTIGAYFDKINAEGGINGRKIKFISLDDGYSPPKTVEQIRKLVEQEQVLLIFNSLGTAHNTAVHKYLNDRKIPQLFVASGATKWDDPKSFPWTMGWQPNYRTEARIYAQYILENAKDPKIGVLYQHDDYGKDYFDGLREGLGAQADKLIVLAVSYETSAPTVDSQIVQLKASGANVFVNITTPKFATQAIKKAFDIEWKPLHLINNVSTSLPQIYKPAGFNKSQGIVTAAYIKSAADPQWDGDSDMKEYLVFMSKYYPSGDPVSNTNTYGYAAAYTMAYVIRQAGDDLTRENIMRHAASLNNVKVPMLLPGITLSTSSTDYRPMKRLRLQQIKGERWELFGPVLEARR